MILILSGTLLAYSPAKVTLPWGRTSASWGGLTHTYSLPKGLPLENRF